MLCHWHDHSQGNGYHHLEAAQQDPQDLLLRDLKKIGLGAHWRSKAKDRNEWKRVVREGVETANECEESREKK